MSEPAVDPVIDALVNCSQFGDAFHFGAALGAGHSAHSGPEWKGNVGRGERTDIGGRDGVRLAEREPVDRGTEDGRWSEDKLIVVGVAGNVRHAAGGGVSGIMDRVHRVGAGSGGRSDMEVVLGRSV